MNFTPNFKLFWPLALDGKALIAIKNIASERALLAAQGDRA
ncbi:hypothetical protein [Acidovorax sp. Root267]|nr:hypothetical protein [Acidovorax sp. Root267]